MKTIAKAFLFLAAVLYACWHISGIPMNERRGSEAWAQEHTRPGYEVTVSSWKGQWSGTEETILRGDSYAEEGNIIRVSDSISGALSTICLNPGDQVSIRKVRLSK